MMKDCFPPSLFTSIIEHHNYISSIKPVIKIATRIANIAHISTHYIIKSITLKCINTDMTKTNNYSQ